MVTENSWFWTYSVTALVFAFNMFLAGAGYTYNNVRKSTLGLIGKRCSRKVAFVKNNCPRYPNLYFDLNCNESKRGVRLRCDPNCVKT